MEFVIRTKRDKSHLKQEHIPEDQSTAPGPAIIKQPVEGHEGPFLGPLALGREARQTIGNHPVNACPRWTTPLSALEYWESKQFDPANPIIERATFPPYNNIELSIPPNDSYLDIRKSKQTTCISRHRLNLLLNEKLFLHLSYSISFPFILFYFNSFRLIFFILQIKFQGNFPFYILYPTLDWQRK